VDTLSDEGPGGPGYTPTSHRAVVVAGGELWWGDLPRIGGAVGQVIAADSGVELALQLGLPCDVVIGDLDSASPEALAEAERLGARLDRHPVDKDYTDLELALDLACAGGAQEIVVLGGGGGRTSHFLGNAALLAGDKYADITITWLLPAAEVQVLRAGGTVTINGRSSDLVSLVPVGGGAIGVTTEGLRWPLNEASLSPGTTRGISNELVSATAAVRLTAGTLLVVHERAR